MATLGLELVDAALVAVQDGRRVAASPGVALLDPAGLVVGAAAAAAWRLRPALATDRFWSELSPESLARPGTAAVSNAHLAEAHLAGLWREIGAGAAALALAVPGAMQPRQLGLALGIARHLGIAVAGSVDAAVAACAGLAARETVLHLDLQLHQSVLTVMDGALRLGRRQVAVAPRVGLRALQAAWAQLASDALVRATRFDPLHQARTEQQLYDRLPGWLGQLVANGEAEAVIEAGGASYATMLRRDACALAAEAWYTQLVELVQGQLPAGEPVTLALAARAAALPGLAGRLAALHQVEIVALDETAAAAGAAAQLAGADAAAAALLCTALPRAQPAPRPEPRRGGAPPTHVLLAGRAHALAGGPLLLGSAPGPGRGLAVGAGLAGVSRRHCTLEPRGAAVLVRDHSRFGTFVNNRRVAGEVVVTAGDRLRLGAPGVVLELVAVE